MAASESIDTCEYSYEDVIRSVMWGEPREEIIGRLQQAGYSTAQAEGVFLAANREREQTIRKHFFRKIGWDVILFFLFVSIWWLVSHRFEGSGRFTRFLMGYHQSMLLPVLWTMIHGLWACYRMIFPQFTEGPIADLH